MLKNTVIDRHFTMRLYRTAQVLRSASQRTKDEAQARRLDAAADALILSLNGDETSRDVLKDIERAADKRFCDKITTLIAGYGEKAKDDPALMGVVETLSMVLTQGIKSASLTRAQTNGE